MSKFNGELKQHEPDDIEKLILKWRTQAESARKTGGLFKEDSPNFSCYKAAAETLEACAHELESAYIGPDPAGGLTDWLKVAGKLGTHASAIFLVRADDGASIDEPPSEGDRVQINSPGIGGDERLKGWTSARVIEVKIINKKQFFYFDCP